MVKVYPGQGNTSSDYADAGHVKVDNGHLLVLSSAGSGAKVVAVYAPDRWNRAEVISSAAK